jgi:hypothetical protein
VEAVGVVAGVVGVVAGVVPSKPTLDAPMMGISWPTALMLSPWSSWTCDEETVLAVLELCIAGVVAGVVARGVVGVVGTVGVDGVVGVVACIVIVVAAVTMIVVVMLVVVMLVVDVVVTELVLAEEEVVVVVLVVLVLVVVVVVVVVTVTVIVVGGGALARAKFQQPCHAPTCLKGWNATKLGGAHETEPPPQAFSSRRLKSATSVTPFAFKQLDRKTSSCGALQAELVMP